MKILLALTTTFLYSCTTCIPNEVGSCNYNCNRDGYSVDYSKEIK